MARAIDRHNSKEARVIPVILHPCDWHSLPFGKLLATPIDGKPVSKYPNQHDAFLEITLAIKEAASHFSKASPPANKTKHSTEVTKSSSLMPEIRSSNLRVKKTFTDRDKDKFNSDAFEYMAKFFEGSLNELAMRNPNIETEFRRINTNLFTATAYVNGSEASSCTIKLNARGDILGGTGISYSYGHSISGNSMNESLSVKNDGYSLYLTPLGMALIGRSKEMLSFEGASELYWELFIRQLQ